MYRGSFSTNQLPAHGSDASEISGEGSSPSVGSAFVSQNRRPQQHRSKEGSNGSNDDPLSKRNPVWGDQHLFQRRLKAKEHQKRQTQKSKSHGRLPPVNSSNNSGRVHRSSFRRQNTSGAVQLGQSLTEDQGGKHSPSRKIPTSGSLWDLEDVQVVEEEEYENTTDSGSQPTGSENDDQAFEGVEEELSNAFQRLLASFEHVPECAAEKKVQKDDAKKKAAESKSSKSSQRISIQQLATEQPSRPGHTITSQEYKKKRQETIRSLVNEVSTIRERISTSLQGLNTKDGVRKRPLSGSRSQLKHAASEGAMAVPDSDKAVQNSRVKALEAFDELLAESLKVREAQAAQLQEIYQQQQKFADKEDQQQLHDQMKKRMKELQERWDHRERSSSPSLRATDMAKSFMNQSTRALMDSLESRAAGSRGDRPILGAELSVHQHIKSVSPPSSSDDNSRHRSMEETQGDDYDEDAEDRQDSTIDNEEAQFEEYLQSVLAMRPDFEGSKSRASNASSRLSDLLQKLRAEHQRKLSAYEKELAERDQEIFQLNDRATKAEKENEDLLYQNKVLEARTRDVDRIENDYRKKVYNHTIQIENQKEKLIEVKNKLSRTESEAQSYRQNALKYKEEASQWKEAYKQKEEEAKEATKKAQEASKHRTPVPAEGLSSTDNREDWGGQEGENVEELREEIATLKEELGRRDNSIRQYKKELEELRNQASSEGEAKEADPEVEDLKRELEELQKYLERTERDKDLLESERDAIKETQKATETKLDEHEQSRRTAETGLSQIEISLTEVLSQISAYTQSGSKSDEGSNPEQGQSSTGRLGRRVKEIQTLEERLKDDVYELCNLHEQKLKEVKTLQDENENLNNRIKQVQETAERKIKFYEGKMSHEAERSTYVSEAADALREEVNRQRQSIKGYIGRTYEIQEENHELRKKLEQSEEQNEETEKMKQQVEEDIKRMDELQRSLQERDEKLEQEMEEQNRIAMEKDSQIEELSKRLTALEFERDELRTQYEKLEEETSNAKQKIEEERAAREQMQSEYDNVKARVELVQNQYEDAEYEKQCLEAEMDGLKEARNVLQLHKLRLKDDKAGTSQGIIPIDRPQSACLYRKDDDDKITRGYDRVRSNSVPSLSGVPDETVDIDELKEFSEKPIELPPLMSTPQYKDAMQYKNAVSSFVWELTRPLDSDIRDVKSARDRVYSVDSTEDDQVLPRRRINSAPGHITFQHFDSLNLPCLNLALGNTDTGRTWYKIDPCGSRRFSDTDMLNKYKYEELHEYFEQQEKEEQEAFDQGRDRTSALHKHQFYSQDSGFGDDENSLIATKGHVGKSEYEDAPASALSELQHQVDCLQSQNAALAEDKKSLQKQNEDYRRELQRYHDQMSTLQCEKEQLQNQVKSLEEEREDIKSQFCKLQEAYGLLRGDCEYYEAKADSLREQCNSLERENEYLNANTVAWSYHRRVEKRLSATVTSHENLEALQLQQAEELEQTRERLKELNQRQETVEEELKRTHQRLRAAYDHESKQWETWTRKHLGSSLKSSSQHGETSGSTLASNTSKELLKLSSSSQLLMRRYGAIRKRLLTQINLLKSVIPTDEAGAPKVKHVTARDIVECASTLKVYVLKEFDALMETLKEGREQQEV